MPGSLFFFLIGTNPILFLYAALFYEKVDDNKEIHETQINEEQQEPKTEEKNEKEEKVNLDEEKIQEKINETIYKKIRV